MNVASNNALRALIASIESRRTSSRSLTVLTHFDAVHERSLGRGASPHVPGRRCPGRGQLLAGFAVWHCMRSTAVSGIEGLTETWISTNKAGAPVALSEC